MHKLKKLDAHPIIKKALMFKLYTGVRGAELLMAEPHHFDIKDKIWRIPALHIKQFRRKVYPEGHEIPDFFSSTFRSGVRDLKRCDAMVIGWKNSFLLVRESRITRFIL